MHDADVVEWKSLGGGGTSDKWTGSCSGGHKRLIDWLWRFNLRVRLRQAKQKALCNKLGDYSRMMKGDFSNNNSQ